MPPVRLRALAAPEARAIPKGALEPLTEILSLRGRREIREQRAARTSGVWELRANIERSIKQGTRGRWDAEAHSAVVRNLRATSLVFERQLSASAHGAARRAVMNGLRDLDAQWKILAHKATGKGVQLPTFDRKAVVAKAMERVRERTSHIGIGSARRAQQRLVLASRMEAAKGRDAMKGPDFAKALAKEIARKADGDMRRVIATEMAAAYNEVALAAIADLRTHYPVRKQWDATLDAKTCVFCRNLHRMVVDVGDLFPGGYQSPPMHPYCRCAVIPYMDSWKLGVLRDVNRPESPRAPRNSAAVESATHLLVTR